MDIDDEDDLRNQRVGGEERGLPPRRRENRREQWDDYVFEDAGRGRRRQRRNLPAPEDRGGIPLRRKQRGRGLKKQFHRHGLKTPDELISRLHLLLKSQSAGNISDDLFNEASSIIDKLNDIGVLSKTQVKSLYKMHLIA